jgi:hypothetical protein
MLARLANDNRRPRASGATNGCGPILAAAPLRLHRGHAYRGFGAPDARAIGQFEKASNLAKLAAVRKNARVRWKEAPQ